MLIVSLGCLLYLIKLKWILNYDLNLPMGLKPSLVPGVPIFFATLLIFAIYIESLLKRLNCNYLLDAEINQYCLAKLVTVCYA